VTTLDRVIVAFVALSAGVGTPVRGASARDAHHVAPSTAGARNRPHCGNEKVEAGETCDDGNTKDGDFCPSNCRIERTSTATSSKRPDRVGHTLPLAGVTCTVKTL
jgi:cysteine-rich repeat protein